MKQPLRLIFFNSKTSQITRFYFVSASFSSMFSINSIENQLNILLINKGYSTPY